MANRNRTPDRPSGGGTAGGPADALDAAAADLRAVRDRVAAVGVDDLVAVVEAYRNVDSILDRYEDRATDWDDFEGYVRFREAMADRLGELPEGIPHREAFAAADDALTTGPQGVLSDDDFERAREHLSPARERVELHERWETVRDRYREARRDAATRRDALDDRIAELERLRTLGEADLDAPVERIREPIETYDRRVREAFEAFVREASARAVLEFVDDAAANPLVDYARPPDALAEYVADAPTGEEPVSTLLAYADYSRSKVDHYVADPQAFMTAVGTNRSYLRELDAAPLTVGWPPPAADRLRWRVRELVPVVARFADEETVALARELRTVAARANYGRLRASALARADLDETERERLRTGAVEDDLRTARERLDRVERALDEHPPLDAFEAPGG